MNQIYHRLTNKILILILLSVESQVWVLLFRTNAKVGTVVLRFRTQVLTEVQNWGVGSEPTEVQNRRFRTGSPGKAPQYMSTCPSRWIKVLEPWTKRHNTAMDTFDRWHEQYFGIFVLLHVDFTTFVVKVVQHVHIWQRHLNTCRHVPPGE
jgi:hypothetical protein